MNMIRPFKGLRPSSDKASEVASPPYDVMSYQEATLLAKDRANSFLHISRPEIDLPEGTDPYSSEVYEKASENLKKLIDLLFWIMQAQDGIPLSLQNIFIIEKLSS